MSRHWHSLNPLSLSLSLATFVYSTHTKYTHTKYTHQLLSECYFTSLFLSLKHGLTPRDCLRDGAPGQRAECTSFRVAFFECKRSLVHTTHTNPYSHSLCLVVVGGTYVLVYGPEWYLLTQFSSDLVDLLQTLATFVYCSWTIARGSEAEKGTDYR